MNLAHSGLLTINFFSNFEFGMFEFLNLALLVSSKWFFFELCDWVCSNFVIWYHLYLHTSTLIKSWALDPSNLREGFTRLFQHFVNLCRFWRDTFLHLWKIHCLHYFSIGCSDFMGISVRSANLPADFSIHRFTIWFSILPRNFVKCT